METDTRGGALTTGDPPYRSSTGLIDPAALPLIDEVDRIEQIERIAANYQTTYGAVPLNVSHWDPSQTMAEQLGPMLKFSYFGENPLKYNYSYTVDRREAVLRKLGFDPATKGCLLTNSGTASMNCAVRWLQAVGVRRITALAPFYFALRYQGRIQAIEVD